MHDLEDSQLQRSTAAIAAAYRRPKILRDLATVQATSLLHGARVAAGVPAPVAVDVYSVLAPGVCEQTTATMLRAPLQVFARLDVLAGGQGRPVAGSPGAPATLTSLAKRIVAARGGNSGLEVAALTLFEISSGQCFGERSVVVGRVAARAVAAALGADPAAIIAFEQFLPLPHDPTADPTANLTANLTADPATEHTTERTAEHIGAHTIPDTFLNSYLRAMEQGAHWLEEKVLR